jgi:hypothetical protein
MNGYLMNTMDIMLTGPYWQLSRLKSRTRIESNCGHWCQPRDKNLMPAAIAQTPR